MPDKRKDRMNTLAKVCKQIVTDAIDHDYLLECGGSLRQIYKSEFGNWNGKTPSKCKDYLQGLPTVCTVPFYNGEILEILKDNGISIPEDDDKSHDLIEAYWMECGKQFWLMID